VKELDGRIGQSQFSLKGQYGEAIDLSWMLQSSQLDDLYPTLRGQLEITGHLSGQKQSPSLTSSVTADNLRYQPDLVIGSLKAELDGTLSDAGLFKGTVAAQNIQVAQRENTDATLYLEGNLSSNQLMIETHSEEDNLLVKTSGSFREQQWVGELHDLKFESRQYGDWHLSEPSLIELASNSQTFSQSCFVSEESRFCIEATRDVNEDWRLETELTRIPIALLHAMFVETEVLDGSISGDLSLTGNGKYVLSGQGQLDVMEGQLHLIHSEIEGLQDIKLKQTTLGYSIQDDELKTSLRIVPELAGVSPLQGDVQLVPFNQLMTDPSAVTMGGMLTLNVADLSEFGSLDPEYQNLSGQLNLDLTLGGTVTLPTMNGIISLNQASVELPSLGIMLTQLSAEARGNKEGVDFVYRAVSGQGDLNGTGNVMLDTDTWRFNTSLKGENLELVALPEAYVTASPDLTVTVTPDHTEITGQVAIPLADLAPTEFNTPVTISDDVVVVNEIVEKPENSKPTKLDLGIILGDEVKITAVGFNGRLTGKLNLTGDVNETLRGKGELVIKDGGYLAYGQKLTIDDGKIIFAGGAVDNPSLDIKAVRKTSTFTAGVQIEGSAADPQMRLFSSPQMDQDNILAHLILGRPLAEASVTDAAMLATAATGLGLTGGGQLSDQISSTFGLDTLAISGNGGDNTALQVGKYLSPKLYLGYGIGIFEPVSTVTLRYKLSQIWSLRAESGTEAGVDLLYTHER
jgi:translocation and assembly module TamB